MENNSFEMTVQAGLGRMKYLLLTICPALLFLELWRLLTERGFLPASRGLYYVSLVLWSGLMILLGYLLIFRKNHILSVEESTIRETDMMSRRVRATIEARQIRSVHRNLLGEWLLKDENGKTLLCIESNMSNRDMLQEWLNRRGLTVE